MRAAAISLALVSIAGCAMGPDYRRPDLPPVEEFRGETATPSAESVADLPWWELFQDDALRSLIGEAIQNNGDLRAAAARVAAARARAGVARDALLPTVGVQAGADRQRTPFVPPVPGVSTITTNVFAASINVSWELDVWGRIRRGAEAAEADYEAVAAQRSGVLLMLIADVAQAYVELLELDGLYDLYKSTRESRTRLLELFDAQLQGGTGTLVQTSNAEALVYDVEAALPPLQAQITRKENQIAILLGKPPGSIMRGPPLDFSRLPPEIPPGLPVSLLERRPDLRALEQNLRAAVARIGVAEANLLPPISLTGLAGLLSAEAGSLLSGNAGQWLYGANTSWLAPILNGKSLRDLRDAAVADAEAATADYQQAVLNALGDVSGALADIRSSRDAAEILSRQVKSLQVRLDLVLDQYRAGVASYVEVTLAYQDLLPAQISLLQADAQRTLTVIQLYRVLGGGWAEPSAPPAADPREGDGGAGP